MELYKLKYFHIAAELGHITKAAESIRIAQPALTQAIHSLEEELGVKLFAKKGRNIVLTDCGVYLKKRLDELLPAFDSLAAEMAQLKHQVRNTIRMNILAASTFVIDSVVAYRRTHPEVVFDFEQNEQKADCDLVITTNSMEGERKRTASSVSNRVARCVKKENIYLAVPKASAFAFRPSVALAEVKDEGFVMLSGSRLFGGICKQFCTAAGFLPKILFESDSPNAVQNIIGTGTGVAFWPEYSWGTPDSEQVRLLPISSPVCERELILELYERVPTSAWAADFYEFLRSRLGG